MLSQETIKSLRVSIEFLFTTYLIVEVLSLLRIATFIVPLLWLTVLLVSWLRSGKINLKWVKSGIIIIIVLFVVIGAYSTVITYNLWKEDPISRYLLPPRQTMYFFKYSFFHYWLGNVLGLAISLFWALFLLLLRKYSKGSFLSKKEIWLGFFTALAVGWPSFIPYLVVSFGLLFILQLFNTFFRKQKNVSLAHGIIISALLVLLFRDFFIKVLDLKVLIV